jgi:uncharacterized membrane protein
VAALAAGRSSRWQIVVAWALGPASLYVLASFAQAALVERNLSVDIGFGRSLAFWIGAIYLALPLWGFLPAHPTGWYARRPIIVAAGSVGVVGAVVSAVYAGLWLAGHWVSSVGVPVAGSVVVLLAAASATLWLAGRESSRRVQSGPADE